MNNAYEKHPYYQYNYEYYPTRAQQIEFLTAYVEEFKRMMKETQAKRQKATTIVEENNKAPLEEKLDEININEENNNNNNSSSNALRNLNIESLLIEANYFALASHLFWAHWSVCQAAVCKIKFDYLVRIRIFIDYAFLTLNRFIMK